MLVKSHHNGIHERILTSKNGQLVRVTFEIIEVGGIMRGRVISVVPVISVASSTKTETAHAPLFLTGVIAQNISEAVEAAIAKPHTSPYISFDFFMSQPTRAPSL